MLYHLKRFARSVAPMPIRHAWGSVYGHAKARRARKAFEAADDRGGGRVLSIDALTGLMRRGYEPPGVIRYDAEGLIERAREKVGQLEARVPLERCRSCIELGCWDGMVLAAVRERLHGVAAYGADRSTDGIDARARHAGVQFVQTDASALAFGSGSVDLIYSFAAFEHFSDPRGVIEESWRVLRPGGYLYLLFGPVYTSPYGLHAYRQIPVPYCQYLFAEPDLKAYAGRQGLPAAWPYVNGVSVTAYRRLWAEQGARFESLYYLEHSSGGVGAELIAEYPFCFRAKVPTFDDLLVSAIEICLRKR
jgi:SAM-dependent methyltransferase